MTDHTELRKLAEAALALRNKTSRVHHDRYLVAHEAFKSAISENLVIALLDEIKALKTVDQQRHHAYVARDWQNAQLRDELAQLRAELEQCKQDAVRLRAFFKASERRFEGYSNKSWSGYQNGNGEVVGNTMESARMDIFDAALSTETGNETQPK